jgi:prepilin-type N-terminal cleavage/methylation domain-containing protein
MGRKMLRTLIGVVKRRKSEDGFTLIELAVVMLIITILIVVSLSFFGSIGAAHSSVAFQDLKGVQVAAYSLYMQDGQNMTYTNTTPAVPEAAEPGVQVSSPGAATVAGDPNSVSYELWGDGQAGVFTMYSANNGGECISMVDIFSSSSSLVPGTFPSAGLWWGISYTTTPAGAAGSFNLEAPYEGTCVGAWWQVGGGSSWYQIPPSSW